MNDFDFHLWHKIFESSHRNYEKRSETPKDTKRGKKSIKRW